MIFLRRKTQKGFFMEEKTKVTAAPTIAEKCGIKSVRGGKIVVPEKKKKGFFKKNK